MRRMVIVLASLLLAGATGPTDTDYQHLTEEMAKRIATAAPSVQIKIEGPLTLKLIGGPQGEGKVHLDRIASHCATNTPADCELQKAKFVEGIAEMATLEVSVTRENLRVIVRPADYAAAMQEVMAQRGGLITRPVGDGLVAILAADFPNTIAMVPHNDLGLLGLAEAEAYELGRRNVLAALPKLPTVTDLHSGIFMFASLDYDASLLLADGWEELAEQTKGRLFLTVASDNMVVVGLADDDDVVRRLRPIAQEGFKSADRGISPEVFRWSETGWRSVR